MIYYNETGELLPAEEGVAKIINSGGTGNCGISGATVYVYAY